MNISVVVTAINHEQTVIESIESILSQTRLPDEIGLALGPSRDETAGMTDFYEDELDFVHHDRRPDVAYSGLMHLRLGSLSSVSGEYVLFLRGDSYLRPRVIERITDPAHDGGVLLSPAEFTGGIGENQRLDPPGEWTLKRLLEAGPLPPGSVVWPREKLVGIFSDLQALKLGPFSTMGWLILLQQQGVESRSLDKPAVEIWDDREGPSCWTGTVFESLLTLGSLLDRYDDPAELSARIRATIQSLPAEFCPSGDKGLELNEAADAVPLEWVTRRVPLVE